MPYERIWVPELNAWKIIGEITGEEALAMTNTIPIGSTQWGWNAQSGTFAYGTSQDSRSGGSFSTPPATVSPILRDTRRAVNVDVPAEYRRTPASDTVVIPGLADTYQGLRPQHYTPVSTTPGESPIPALIGGLGIVGALVLAIFAMGKKR